MRTLIDLPDRTIAALADLSQTTGQSRAALVRQAVDAFLASQQKPDLESGFGLWGASDDGLALQSRLRGEW